MIHRINNCDALLKRNEIESFLKRVLTGDKKKWITYHNRKIVDKGWWAVTKVREAWIWRLTRWCCVCGGIERESYTMSYFQLVRRLVLKSSADNKSGYARQLKENGPNWIIAKVLTSIMKTPDHTLLWWPVKSCESLDGKFCLLHLLVQT